MNGRTNAKNGAGAIRDGCAVLEVKAPAHSQITAIRSDGLTKKQDKGYIDLINSDYWFYYIIIQKFELSSLIWTVTATFGTDSISDTILINDNKQYDLWLDDKAWLVYHGVLLATFTHSSYASLDQLTEYTQMIISGNNYGQITTQNQIDVTDFSVLRLKLCKDSAGKYGQSYCSASYPTIGVGSSRPSEDTTPNYDVYTKLNAATGQILIDTFSVDLSAQSGLKYVSMLISSASSLQGYANIYDFYLEQ